MDNPINVDPDMENQDEFSIMDTARKQFKELEKIRDS
jgi:hypothetical protein